MVKSLIVSGDISSIIKNSRKELAKKLQKQGVKTEVIELILQGKNPYQCPYCNTPNLVKVDEKKDFIRYECHNCDSNGYKYYIDLK